MNKPNRQLTMDLSTLILVLLIWSGVTLSITYLLDRPEVIYVPQEIEIIKEVPKATSIIVNIYDDREPVVEEEPVEEPETTPAYFYDQELFEIDDEAQFGDIIKTLEGETQGQDLTAKRLAFEVMCNRTLYPVDYGSTLYEVLSKKNQFEVWRKRNNYEITSESIDAFRMTEYEDEPLMAKYALEGIDPTRYVYFCTPAAYEKVGYKYMHNTFRYGGHIFGTN